MLQVSGTTGSLISSTHVGMCAHIDDLDCNADDGITYPLTADEPVYILLRHRNRWMTSGDILAGIGVFTHDMNGSVTFQ